MRARLLATGLLTAVVAAGVVVGLPAIEAAGAQTVSPPKEDPFYQPPAGYESLAPGTLLRSRDVTVTGLGIPVPVRSWQTLARSTDATGRPATVASTLMVPLQPYFGGKRPLLSYQTAIDSLGDQCNPSYTLRTGTEKELPLIALGLLRGWAVVVSDYQGPRDAYGAGPMEGHGVLDGIRAVEQLSGTGLSGVGTPVGLLGYSGGGLATSWAAELQPNYAAELNLRGIASGGTPAALSAAGRQMDGGPFSGLFLAAAVGISREYPEILTLMNDAGRAMVEQVNDMCVEQESSTFAFRRLAEFTTVSDPLSHPTVAGVLSKIELGKVTPSAPVYLYHSRFDELIPYAGVQALAKNYCAHDGKVQFYTDFLSEHVVLAATGAPAAVAYLGDRFAGRPAPSNCG